MSAQTIRLFVLSLLLTGMVVSSMSVDYPAILSARDEARVINEILLDRLETVLPEVMRREQVDMWIVICREYNEDPVYLTLMPEPVFAARRLSMLVFYDGGEEGFQRMMISRSGRGDYYRGVWNPDQETQWECLSRIVRERNPARIGINSGDTFAFGDGLSASLLAKLKTALGPELAPRLCNAERVAVGWLETRTQAELEIYPQIIALGHAVIAEAFSRQVITPGVTTVGDVGWWMRQKIQSMGMRAWFQPNVTLQRCQESKIAQDRDPVIHRGDFIHCDVGLTYLRLNTDIQQNAYILKEGEDDAPAGFKDALKQGNRLQDILLAEYSSDKTGNDVLLDTLSVMKSEEINGSVYTHPLGFHGHAAGPLIGLWDRQEAIPGRGEYPIYLNTCYSIELNVKVKIPEWDGQEVQVGLEEDAAFVNGKVYFLDGRQTEWFLVK